MIKQSRFFAENGADAIIGHHTHCISGSEIHNGVPIFYSLGNMLFTIPNKNHEWYTGLILELEFEKSKMLKWKIHPIEQSQKDFKVSLLNGSQKERILNKVDKYSKIIKNEKEFTENWRLFIQSKKTTINIFSPISSVKMRYLKGALNRLGFNKLFLKNDYLKQILNHIRCEAHKDVVTAIIKDEIYKNK
jgi:poly-gamma-glutamate synthesis protein (capsule biosynthesis protein)